jgi:hypothetical protein
MSTKKEYVKTRKNATTKGSDFWQLRSGNQRVALLQQPTPIGLVVKGAGVHLGIAMNAAVVTAAPALEAGGKPRLFAARGAALCGTLCDRGNLIRHGRQRPLQLGRQITVLQWRQLARWHWH